YRAAGRQIRSADQPQGITGPDLAATTDYGLMQQEAAPDELAAATVEPRRVGGLCRAALALPPENRDEYRQHGEAEELPGPGQLREQIGQHPDRGCGDADPQQVAAADQYFEDQQHGAEGQPVPE